MKKIKFLFVLLVALSSYIVNAQNFTVNIEKSTVYWLGKKITGEHYGYINISDGELTIVNNQISSGKFTIDMNSMTCTDIEDQSMNKKLLGHLKSDDFFGTSKYPTAQLEIVSATEFNSNKCNVKGKLTIKGKTELITFKVNKDQLYYSTKLEIDRSKYDVRYGSTSFFDSLGNRAIDDIFTLEIKLYVN
tara:strand:- start:1915 stop:2484 length:570 start_codon:yes stop_codon:yes gene_type:complete